MTQKTEKRAKFIRLAEGRVQGALNAIRKIGNLSNNRAYDYDEADVKKIMKALKEAVSDAERRFSSSDDQADTFKL